VTLERVWTTIQLERQPFESRVAELSLAFKSSIFTVSAKTVCTAFLAELSATTSSLWLSPAVFVLMTPVVWPAGVLVSNTLKLPGHCETAGRSARMCALPTSASPPAFAVFTPVTPYAYSAR
jgi:hypothetical protein